MEKAIQVKGLRKSFKDTEVLKGVDFEVRRGARGVASVLGIMGVRRVENQPIKGGAIKCLGFSIITLISKK